jgi:hypothetical protein
MKRRDFLSKSAQYFGVGSLVVTGIIKADDEPTVIEGLPIEAQDAKITNTRLWVGSSHDGEWHSAYKPGDIHVRRKD